MGRRPNQLILEYFERGPKLEDASNRYQHTCKSCGEKFPKGRIDSLTNHLVKKCPALPLQDRQRALLQMHELPLPDNMTQTNNANASGTSQMQHGQEMNLPFAPSKQLSALETLAEVSRQHLDLSGKRMAEKQPSQMHNNNNSHNNHHSSHAGLLEEFLIQDDRPDGSDLGGLSHGLDMTNAPTMPSMYQFNGSLHHSPSTSPHMGHMPLSNSNSMAHMVPSLVMAASAANDLMPLTNGMAMESDMNLSHGMHGISDGKFFHPQGRGQWPNIQPNSLDPMLQDHGKEQMQATEMLKGMGHPRPLAMNPGNQTHFTTDFSMNQKPAKPKVRGRFTDTRRKEVQEVRKRGACIRCRMLKKPCSGENPCNTCQNVESARLWKQPCIRTRIAEEFGLYSAGLHSVLAFHATNQAKGQIRLDQTPGRIEASHFPDSATFVTFIPLKCQQSQAAQNTNIDPAIFAGLSSPDLELIDGDDDVSGKLDHYIKKMGGHFSDTEDSDFMRATVHSAKSIASSSQDGLISKALELWNLTRILTSRNFEWHIFSNPSLAPTMAPAILAPADIEDGIRTPITSLEHAASYNLITMQLMGATEKRAACLARIVMNDLERRLLQRQQANPFETFLVAVMLLACVERMCWLFRSWELPFDKNPNDTIDGTFKQQQSLDADLASALQSNSSPSAADDIINHQSPRNPRWPLDKSPSSFSQQGDKFSDILNMLLKMRGVPPKPTPRSPDGVLAVWSENTNDKAREWYDGIAVTAQMLDDRANALFVGEEPKEWELKFVGKIIRGD
ncbi:GAL4 domain containing protein [Pyrenophora tritici-repentis]|nr:GAL4 domain containing protein [Pyrenophora tritici-repentis]